MSRDRFGLTAAGLAAVATAVALLLGGCKKQTGDSDWPDKPGPKVAVSFAPLYCFAVNVAGDDAAVRNVMTTTGPHDFNPTEKDVRLVSGANLLLGIGLGLDDGPLDLIKKGSGSAGLKIVALGKSIPKDKLREGHCEHAHHDANHKHDEDPHVWLSPDHAAILVNAIRDELKAADPPRAAGYEQRAAAYVAKLNALKTYGTDKFKGLKDNRLVSFHDSLTYFAETYGLEIRAVLTQKPGQEPDEKQMKKLIRICSDETKPTRVIAVEPQYSKSTSGDTLKKELLAKGVKNPVLVEIDTLETVKPDDLTADWYEKRMRANIDALAEALK